MRRHVNNLPGPSLETPMREFQEYYNRSFDAYSDETLEEFLVRKGETTLLNYLRAIQ